MPGAHRMRRVGRAMFGGPSPRVVPPAEADAADAAAIAAAVRAERDNYYQMLAAATADAIFTTSLTGVITFFNEGAERLLGYRAADVVGTMRGIDLHLAEEVADGRGGARCRARAGRVHDPGRKGAHTREWTFVCKDGSHVRVTHTVTTQRDDSGAVVGFVGLAHDITARHQSELALRKSEERFRALSEHAPVGIVQTDEHGSCWYANRRFCELAGRSEGEVRGSGWIEALNGHDHAGVLDRWSHELGAGPRLRQRVPGRPPRRHRGAPARDRRADPGRRRARDGLRHHHAGHLRARRRAAAPVGVRAALPRHARERRPGRGAARRERAGRLLQPAPGRDARAAAGGGRRPRLVLRASCHRSARGRGRPTSGRCAARSSCPTTRTRSSPPAASGA